jgi:uncharacterized phiE125 gp8 family phage protein
MELQVKTEATVEPVTLAELKNYLKYGEDNTVEDSLITSIGIAARKYLEGRFNLSLASQTLVANYHTVDIDDNRVKLPRGPHTSITSVKMIDAEGGEETLTLNTAYYLRGNQFKEIQLLSNNFAIDAQEGDYTYQIEYVAGYTSCPSDIKICILDVAKMMYDNRGTTMEPMTDKIYNVMLSYKRSRVL